MSKGILLGIWFVVGMAIGTVAALQGAIVGVAGGAAMMGGGVGYLIGRIDLRKELGLPQS